MKKLVTSTGLLLAIVLFLAINITSNLSLTSARIDLTENKLYTLSTGTENILANLPEPITLRLYLSQKLATNLAGISSYTQRVRELLLEYARTSNGQLSVQIIDPDPFSEEEDRAVGYGLQGIPLEDGSQSFYFGLAGTNSVDNEEVIAFFQPNRAEFLEYDITKLIYQLAYPQQKVVGIMSSLPLQGSPQMPFGSQAANAPWVIVEQIEQLFDVRSIAMDATEFPEDLSILMLVHPKQLSDASLYAIEQFILKGGKAIIFADPYAENDSAGGNPYAAMQAPKHSNLDKLFSAWGVKIDMTHVVGDLDTAQKVQMQKQGRTIVIDYPIWMDLDKPHYFNAEDVTTAKLENITFATAGAIELTQDSSLTWQPLIQSSPNAMRIPSQQLGMQADPEALVQNFKAEKRFTLAARLTGTLKTAFPAGQPTIKNDTGKVDTDNNSAIQTNTPQLMQSVQDVNIVIVADTDLLADRAWVQVQNFLGQQIAVPQAGNANFVTNILDNLSGSSDLIKIRNRGMFNRPFTRIEALQHQAEQQFREQEQQLTARLQETERKLLELHTTKQDQSSLLPNAAQQQALEGFREEKIKIRKALRDVQHALNKNIAAEETRTKFINIGLIPLVVGFGGIVIYLYRNRRRRKGLNIATR